ncbi:hypothetical protein IGI39_003722 [Enterococcus sp. AZ135]|uniref:hypothetical protein n=1 Tax=unclassified Enterococcus TaxID=2608891 RepID=UPI003F25603C
MTDEISKDRRIKKKRIVLLLILILFVLFFLLFKQLYKNPNVTISSDVPDGEFAKKLSSNELEKYLQDKADKNYMRIQMNPSMLLNNERVLSLKLVNSPKNVYAVRIVTSIEGEKEKIYDSGLVEPGEYVEKGRLKKELDRGIYKTLNKVMYYDDERMLVGQSNLKGQLSVPV